MIKSKVRVENIEGLDAQIDEVIRAIEGNLDIVAEDVKTEAQSTSMFADKTGNLRKSIGKRKSKFENGGYIVYARAPHAHLIEYGHYLIAWGHSTGRRVAARPFMRKAVERGISKAVQVFRSSK